ncbi:MAG TPA: SURF1 family protein [Ramlibacter sp.]|nr:SURF1 family protein [Ramlibacter sp.]
MRRYGIFIIGAAAAALFISLGSWQLRRLHQRRALRARVEQRERMDALDLAALSEVGDSLSYRAVTVRGRYDFAHQLLVTYRVVDEITAVYVVTPLRYGDRAVLVERGWTPSADGYNAPLAALREPDTATVTGVLVQVPGDARPEGDAWPLHVRRDAAASLHGRFPYPLFPLVLRRTHAAGPLPMGLRLLAAPQLDNGPHLSYAIQWYSFAAIAIVGPVILFWNERKRRKGAAPRER